MKIAQLVLAFYVSFTLLSIPIAAQTHDKEHVADFIQCSISIENETWSKNKPIYAVVQIENISEKKVDILGTYGFEVANINDEDVIMERFSPFQYWSPVNIVNATPLDLIDSKVPEGSIHLEPREIKLLTFNLNKLHWNKSASSVWPYKNLFEVVPKGDYDLTFSIETDLRRNSDNIPIVTHVVSNKVRVVIE